MEDVLETMYGGALPVASKKKRKLTKEEYLSEADDDEEASEPQKKKAKNAKVAPQVEATGSNMPTIQKEVEDPDPAKVLDKRTRSGKSVETSQPQSAQSIPKKKRKHHVRKLKESPCVIEKEDQIEAATRLVTREIRRKRAVEEAALQKALEIAREIEVLADVLLNESTIEASQLGIELTENLQQLVMVGDMMDVEGVQKEAACSEVDASEAKRGNIDSLNTANVIEIESSSTLAFHSTSVLTSSDIDNIPLNRVYANLHKIVSPSPSTKLYPPHHLFLKE